MEKVKTICVFFICGLGDAVCSLPGLFALQDEFKNSKLTLVVNEPLVSDFFSYFKENFELIDLSRWSQSNLFQKLVMLNRLREKSFDLVISRAQGQSLKVPLLIWATGGRRKIGGANERLKFMYHELAPMVYEQNHTMDRILSLMSYILGRKLEFNSWDQFNLKLHSLKKGTEKNPRFHLPENNSKKNILIAPANMGKIRKTWNPGLKTWPISHYRNLVSALIQSKFNVLITGSHKEKAVADQIAYGWNPCDGVFNFCGDGGIEDVLQNINQSHVVVGHDSGILHLAAMLSIPVIALFGPTSPQHYSPKGKNAHVIWGYKDCRGCYPQPTCGQPQCEVMAGIQPEQVLKLLAHLT